MTKREEEREKKKNFEDFMSLYLWGSLLDPVGLRPPYMPLQNSFPDLPPITLPLSDHIMVSRSKGREGKIKKKY